MPAWFHAPEYALARLVLQRGLGLVYGIAFLVTLEQFRPLAGEKGLTPAPPRSSWRRRKAASS
jgi:hypothetical protein